MTMQIITTNTINCTEKSDSTAKAAKSGDKYISEKEFYYADTKRYTIDGPLPLKETDIKTVPTIVLGGIAATLFYLQHEGQMNTIWSERGPFHFYEDGHYALYADKAGHFFGAYYSSYLWREAYMAIGMSWDASAVWGGLTGLAYSTYVEILDGFAVKWGFSPTDFYSDVAGALFFVGQHYFPYLQNFTPKFMYVPPRWHGDNDRIPSDMFIDNYSAHTLWLSVNVYNMMPDTWKNYWPSWMELSFGFAVRNLCQAGPGYKCDPNKAPLYKFDDGWQVYGDPKFIVGLDYNLVKLLPDGCNTWNWIRQSLNYIKFPAPAIEFGATGTSFHLFYPFKLDLGIKM